MEGTESHMGLELNMLFSSLENTFVGTLTLYFGAEPNRVHDDDHRVQPLSSLYHDTWQEDTMHDAI